ncbi:uncharacterized protein TNCV_975191 [Trichonephila clavipes]|nr:uncharacterized protein TNCV_975191 [Trichonephila clavipes]
MDTRRVISTDYPVGHVIGLDVTQTADRAKFTLIPTARYLPLTPAHCRARLQLCFARSGWNHADWRRIAFSDESRFQLYPDDHGRRIWCHPGQQADSAFNFARHTCPQPGVTL